MSAPEGQTRAGDYLLTPAENRRFVTWLRFEAHTHKQMAEQLEKLGPIHAGKSKQERALAAAKLLVADDIESWEEQTIGGAP